MTKLVSMRDKVFLAGLCVMTTLAAVATIDRMSPEIFDFQWAQAAREFNWTITTLLRKLAFSPVWARSFPLLQFDAFTAAWKEL